MPYLRDKIAELYTDRADLLERIAQQHKNPETAAKIKEAMFTSRMRMESAEETMAGLIAATFPNKLETDKLQAELKWTEAQILAILRNPGLA